jgi:hypothetical protein
VDLGEVGSFRVSDARAAGYSRAAFDARRFELPFHGIRSPLSDHTLATRCVAYTLRMRSDAAFTSLTAAAIWGMPLPAAVDLSKLRVSVPHGRPRPRARGIIGSERVDRVAVTTMGGLRVLAPAATWASLSRDLGCLDLIAVGDDIVGDRRGRSLATLDELRTAIIPRSPGAATLARALRYIRVGSRSRPETLSRVLFVTSGIPEPELNYWIPELGVYLDLAWPAARFGYEYQGGHHVDSVRHAADIERQERVHDVDWLLMEATKFDLFDRAVPTVERVRSRLAGRGILTRRVDPPIWAWPRR